MKINKHLVPALFLLTTTITASAVIEKTEASVNNIYNNWFFIKSKASPVYSLCLPGNGTPSYRINYELNGGIAENPDSYTSDSETITLKAPKKKGYSFIGWLEDNDKFYIAHRGYSFRLPENTEIAVREAIDLGYSHIEIDVRFTADGVPVILHDDTIDRTARFLDGEYGGNISIRDLTYEDALRYYDFGLYKYEQEIITPDFGHVKIMTLDDFLNICKTYNITPVVELKAAGSDNTGKKNLPKVAELLKKYNIQDKTIISSGSLGWLKEMHDIYLKGYPTKYCVSLTPNSMVEKYDNINTISEFTEFIIDNDYDFIEYIGPEWKMITDDLFSPNSNIQDIKENGFKVTTWTINSTVSRKIADDEGNTTTRKYSGEILANNIDVDSIYTDALLPRYSLTKTIPTGSSGDKSFRAMYKKNDRTYLYSITFDGNGADEGSIATIVNFHEINGQQHIITLPENSFVRDGYVFKGWNTDKNGSGEMYNDKASFSIPSSDTILYAIWEKL